MALVAEASVEGIIQAITADGDGAKIQVMGMEIVWQPDPTGAVRRTIKTPTKTLTIAEFTDPHPLPGRMENGFVGGTIIAEGAYDTDAKVLTANTIEVEPSENVLIGALTENAAGVPRKLRINGVPIVMLTDHRIPSNPEDPGQPLYLNQFGFPMKIESAELSPIGPTPNPPPPPTSAEGYFAHGEFHAFKFEYGKSGELVLDPALVPQIAIERAQYRERGSQYELETRGAVTTAHSTAPPDVEVFRVDETALGPRETPIDRADIDIVEAGYARWRLSGRFNKPPGLPNAPAVIRVKNNAVSAGTSPARADLEPDVREE